MKKILILLVLALSGAAVSFAQDARGRVPETVVSDVLAAMPCDDAATLAQNVRDLAVSAPATVELLAGRLGEQGGNALAEYALSSLAAFVSDPANAQYKNAVREGFAKGIAKQVDPVNLQFLLAQLRLFATADDIDLYKKYVSDGLFGSAALATIADLGGKDAVLELVENGAASKTALADIIADKGYAEAEPALLRWAAASTDRAEKNAIAEALGRVGGESSLGWLKANSLADYMVALRNIPEKKAVKAAKEILSSGTSGLQCAAAEIIMDKDTEKGALKVLLNILKSEDRPLRNAALTAATSRFGTDVVAPILTKAFAKLGDGAKTDIVNWLGANKIGETTILSALNASGELGDAAVRSAGLLGTQTACDALISQLAGSRGSRALDALKAFSGPVASSVLDALKAPVNETQLNNLMALASAKEMKAAAPVVLEKARQGSPAAVDALAGVVGPTDAGDIASLLASVPESMTPAVQKALLSSIHTLTPDEQTEKILDMVKLSAIPARYYYPVLGAIGTDKAAEFLRECANDPAAKDALLKMDNATVIPDLLASAEEGNETSLQRYIDMLSTYEQNADKKRLGLAEAIGLAKTPALRSRALGKLGDMPYMKAFLLAAQSLDDTDANVRYAAASAVKNIASK